MPAPARRFAAVTLAAVALSGIAAASAQDQNRAAGRPAPAPAVITGVSDNDLYAPVNRDRHYSNGLRLGWMSGDEHVPDWARSFASSLPLLLDPAGSRRIGWTVAQEMFTPQNKAASGPLLDDRPYAAWLYAGLKLQSETADRLDTLEIDLGVVGPAALGEQAQNDWHQFIGVSDASGWSHQIKNEPGIDLMFERSWRVPLTPHADEDGELGIDVVPNAVASLGNIFTYGGGGATFRFGQYLNSDFGPPRMSPAAPGSDSFHIPRGLGWYLFVGAEGRAVLRNITLDGNTFADSQSVRKRPLVADLQGGLALLFDHARLTYTVVARTKEFYGQHSIDFIGAGALSIAF